MDCNAPGDGTGCDLCLVVPPFDEIKVPQLGTSILAAACRARGLRVTTIYGSIMLSSRVGYDPYKAVLRYYLDCIVGERLFRPYAYPGETLAKLPALPPLSPTPAALHDRLAPHIEPFLRDLTDRVLALRPRIVGIASIFEQIMASSALALRLKQAAPDICIVMGGANVAAPMGAGLAQVLPWIDHFFSGEADIEFPDFCERLVTTGERPAARVIECQPIRDMSRVAAPDYSDFVAAVREAHENGDLPLQVPEGFPMESSRGCWWGMKNHCTFCGLNGDTMDFRTKATDQVRAEIEAMTGRWDAKRIFFTDNIMPLRFFNDLLPALAQQDEPPRLFFEVKANLRDDQLDLMMRAGIDEIQPGIESLSTNVLRLMRKGVSALQNLALLRSCRSVGMHVLWNFLYGFPGEKVEDYEAVPSLIPLIEHLVPPLYCVPIVIDRFSPHHKDHRAFGIESISPYRGFEVLFPPGAPVGDIAYHFIGNYSTPLLADTELVERIRAAFTGWKAQWAQSPPPMLRVLDTGADGVAVADTRRIAKERMTAISRERDAVLQHFERPRPRAGLERELEPHVAALLQRNFLIQHEGQLLSVVTRPRHPAASRYSRAVHGRRGLAPQHADAG